MRNISSKNYRENEKHTFYAHKTFSPENRAVYEIMWQATDDIRRMRTAW